MKFKSAQGAIDWYFKTKSTYFISSRDVGVIATLIDIEQLIEKFPIKIQKDFCEFATTTDSDLKKYKYFNQAMGDFYRLLEKADYLMLDEAA